MLSIPRVQPALSHDCGNFELGAKIALGGDIGSIETLANRVKQGICKINVAVSPNALSVRHVDPVIILFILSIHTDIGKEGKRLENMAFLSQSRAVRMSSILPDINQHARKIVEETHFNETDISREPAQNLGNDLMNLETDPRLRIRRRMGDDPVFNTTAYLQQKRGIPILEKRISKKGVLQIAADISEIQVNQPFGI